MKQCNREWNVRPAGLRSVFWACVTIVTIATGHITKPSHFSALSVSALSTAILCIIGEDFARLFLGSHGLYCKARVTAIALPHSCILVTQCPRNVWQARVTRQHWSFCRGLWKEHYKNQCHRLGQSELTQLIKSINQRQIEAHAIDLANQNWLG